MHDSRNRANVVSNEHQIGFERREQDFLIIGSPKRTSAPVRNVLDPAARTSNMYSLNNRNGEVGIEQKARHRF